jgi:hypothetical protein
MLSPTSMFVYDEGCSVVGECARFVTLGYAGLFFADVSRFRGGGMSRADVPLPSFCGIGMCIRIVCI